MANDPNADTEFNDALRAQGILPPKPPSRSPSPDIPHISHADAVRAIASTAEASTLSNLLEADNLDSDDERMFEDYRRKRMAEMKKEEKKGRFGMMMPLGREDFVKEVTEGSKARLPGEEDDEEDDEDDDQDQGTSNSGKLKGTGVVVFLFKDSIPLSQHIRPLLNRLAEVHPSTKFLSIPADLCIPNYPDKNVPTLLVYRDGEMLGNVVAGMGLKGMKTTIRVVSFNAKWDVSDLEALLIHFKAIDRPSRELINRREDDSDADDDLEDAVGTINARSGGIRSGNGARGRRKDDDDSDLDL